MSDTVQRLLALREELDWFIRGAESWAASYRDDEKSFHDLLRAQGKMQSAVERYFNQVSEETIKKINWSKFKANQVAAADNYIVDVDVSDSDNTGLFLEFVYNPLNDAALAGLKSAYETIGKESSKDLSKTISDSVEKYCSQLIKDIDAGTASKINSAIEAALNQGLTLEETTLKIQDQIFGPERAKLIAHTEAVRAYAAGRVAYANDTGAVAHALETNPGACKLCLENEAQGEIPIDQDFVNGNIPVHPRCYCFERFVYATD